LNKSKYTTIMITASSITLGVGKMPGKDIFPVVSINLSDQIYNTVLEKIIKVHAQAENFLVSIEKSGQVAVFCVLNLDRFIPVPDAQMQFIGADKSIRKFRYVIGNDTDIPTRYIKQFFDYFAPRQEYLCCFATQSLVAATETAITDSWHVCLRDIYSIKELKQKILD